jgi:hypothetical protein
MRYEAGTGSGLSSLVKRNLAAGVSVGRGVSVGVRGTKVEVGEGGTGLPVAVAVPVGAGLNVTDGLIPGVVGLLAVREGVGVGDCSTVGDGVCVRVAVVV